MTKRSRRRFLADSATAAFGAMIVPRHILGRGWQAPSDTLNIAICGPGGMGMSNTEQLLSQNIVALCDVDFGYVERSLLGRVKPSTGQPGPTAERCLFRHSHLHRQLRQMHHLPL